MERNSVGRERIQNNQVVMIPGRLQHGNTTITQHYVHVGGGIVQIGEVAGVTSQPGDIRIYFVERPLLTVATIGGKSSGPQAYNGHLSARRGGYAAEEVAQGPSSIVVAGRVFSFCWIGALSSVLGST